MSDTEIFDQVRDIFSDVMDVTPDQVVPEATPDTIDTWDSLRLLNLVLACEDAFSICIDPEEVERLTSVRAVIDTVTAKM